ncbi:hypothetical protein EDB85DRAFT_946277 [Lactarius pseudohatsudake]|nr:hypothetical protein EDB85DRAFT_946277 [Lactarius pseudohatsudake]
MTVRSPLQAAAALRQIPISLAITRIKRPRTRPVTGARTMPGSVDIDLLPAIHILLPQYICGLRMRPCGNSGREVDLFDGHWAQRAADISVTLDFVLPVPPVTAASHAVPPPPLKIGHNLYDKRYTILRLPIPCTSVPLRNGITRGRRIPVWPAPLCDQVSP